NKVFVLVFYSDWCSNCVRFSSVLKKLKIVYQNDYDFVLLNIASPKNKKLANSLGISELPGVFLLNPKNDNLVHISGGLVENYDRIKHETDRFLRINKHYTK
ncbi:MAG: thioredoxin family protein, partial [Candidatus Gastranaerophilales bacterium]|nr:thioredoxin family protein [Candidatus Gastranaerophilales bacterium]